MEIKKILKNLFAVALFVAFIIFPSVTEAAGLGFSPSVATREVGSTFSVRVYVSSTDKSMNAVSGVVFFPTDKLEVVSVSKSGSVMNLWVQEPSFSNSQGTVNFEAVVLNPGYIGSQGTILTVTFRAKAAGQANIGFSSGSVLANDGSGSNILESLGTANFLLQAANPAVVTPSVTPVVAPISRSEVSNSFIKSATHPDQAKWYSNDSPEFSWVLPSGALEVRTAISSSSLVLPTVKYAPAINNKKVTGLSDGTYYFALQIRTPAGWGDIHRYRVNIDTTPPNPFKITFPHGTTGWEPQPVILFNTTDDQSGINKYDVKVGDGGPARIAPSATSNPYPLPPQYPGHRTVTVVAIDEAGNTRTASEDFTIQAIEAPIVTYYQEEVESGDIVKIRGTTYPNSDITVLFKEDGEIVSEEYTRSNSIGDWAVISSKRLMPGVYIFTARVTDGRGAQSDETAPLTIVVKSRFITDFTDILLNYLSIIIITILCITAVVLLTAYAWYTSNRVIRKLKKESREAERVVEKSFRILRKNINEHINKLRTAKTQRKLSNDEIEFLEKFEEELSDAKDTITKEVEDVSHQ